ncbi:MAG TPA: hypothetical protein VJI67_04195, partial [archaeon]|nr:hypothetical protein [archaeon]
MTAKGKFGSQVLEAGVEPGLAEKYLSKKKDFWAGKKPSAGDAARENVASHPEGGKSLASYSGNASGGIGAANLKLVGFLLLGFAAIILV